jgi:hypothetical protein
MATFNKCIVHGRGPMNKSKCTGRGYWDAHHLPSFARYECIVSKSLGAHLSAQV